jgi:hypothetical protein
MTSRGLLAVGLLVCLQACGTRFGSGRSADWDRDAADAKVTPQEQAVALPAYPRESDLVEFRVGATSSHRFFVDPTTLDVGADGVVRYALVVKTEGGANNATYEGIRCASYEKRVYAVGTAQRKWIEARRSVWEAIQPDRANEYQAILYAEYFCPDRRIVPDKAAAVRALGGGIFRRTYE